MLNLDIKAYGAWSLKKKKSLLQQTKSKETFIYENYNGPYQVIQSSIEIKLWMLLLRE